MYIKVYLYIVFASIVEQLGAAARHPDPLPISLPSQLFCDDTIFLSVLGEPKKAISKGHNSCLMNVYRSINILYC